MSDLRILKCLRTLGMWLWRMLFRGPSMAPSDRHVRRLRLMQLEDRRVLNASIGLATGIEMTGGEELLIEDGGMEDVGGGVVQTVDLTLDNGTWSVDGGIDSNLYDLSGDGKTLTVDQTLINDGGAVLNGQGELLIQGSDANTDTVTLDLNGLDFIPTAGVVFAGGEDPGGTDNDSLTITGYSLTNADGVADVTVSHTGAESGTVTLAGLGTVEFSEIEPLTLGGTAADLVINLPAGADNDVVLSDDLNFGNGVSQLASPTNGAFETTTFANPTNSLTILDGSGAKTIKVEGLDSLYSADLTIDADSDDTVVFQTATTDLGGGDLTVDAETIRVEANINATDDAAISLTATRNIDVSNSADIAVVDGSASLIANQGAVAGDFDGIRVRTGSVIQTTGEGDISMTGTGGSDAGAIFQAGIQLDSGSEIRSTSAVDGGEITLNGTGGFGTNGSNIGVDIDGGAIRSVSGNIEIIGQGGSGSFVVDGGVVLSNSAVVESTGTGADAATITIDGTGGTGNSLNLGVGMDTNAVIRSTDGNISITGQGGTGPAGVDAGVSVYGGSSIQSLGTTANAASITIVGTGGGAVGSNNNHGVSIAADGTATSKAGEIMITGTAGVGNSHGVIVDEVDPGFPPFFDPGAGSIISTGDANIVITATGSGTADDFRAGNNGVIGGPANMGNITISADTIALSGTVNVQSAGALIIKPRTASTTIGIGGGTGTLNLTDAELALLADGFSSITIGDTMLGTGAVDVDSSTFTDDVTIAGGSIAVTELRSAGNTVTLKARTGSITDGGEADKDVTATTAVFEAASGIGSGNALETQITNLTFTNTTNQTNITNTGALIIAGASDFGQGGKVAAASPMTVNANVTSAADFTLEAVGGGGAGTDDLTINADVRHTGGVATDVITLRAGDDVLFTGGTVSLTGGGTILVTADTEGNNVGGISQTGGTLGSGTETLNANSAQAVSLTSASNAISIIEGSVSVAGEGFTYVGSNTYSVGNGNITTNNGAISLTENSGGSINFESAAANISNGAGTNTAAITLQADDMAITGTITAGAGLVTLRPNTGSTAIEIGSGASSAGLDITDTELDRITTTGGLTIGGVSQTGNISIVGTADQATAATITGGTFTVQTAGTINVGADLTNDIATALLAGNLLNFTGGNVATTGDLITLQGTNGIILAANTTIDSTNGGAAAAGANVTFSNAVRADNSTINDRTLTVTAGTGGTVQFVSTVGAGATGQLADLDTNANLTRFGGDVTVNDGAASVVAIDSAVQLDSNVTITTDGTNDHDLNITGAVNADAAANARTLTILAGSADAIFGSSIGATEALADLDVTAALTRFGGDVAITAAAAGGSESVITGAVQLDNDVTINTDGTNDVGLHVTGAVNADNSANDRKLTVTAGTATARFGSTIGFVGALADLDITAATIRLGGNIRADSGAGETVTLDGNVQLDGNVNVDVDDGLAGTAATSVAITGNLNADNSANARRFSVSARGGTIDFQGQIGNSQALADLDIVDGNVATTIQFNGDVKVDAAGGNDTILLDANVLLMSDVSFDLAGTNKDLTITGTTDSQAGETNNLQINTGSTKDVTFMGAVGSGVNQELGTVTINNARNVELQSTIEATSFTQTTGAGTTTLNGGTLTGTLNITTASVSFASGTMAVNSTADVTASNAITGGTDDNTADLTATVITLSAGAGGIGTSATNLDLFASTRLDASTTAAGADFFVDGIGNLNVGQLNAGTGTVAAASTAAIVDARAGDGSGNENIIASAAALRAATGIGSSDALDTSISSLAASNNTSGNIQIDNSVGGLLTITTVDSLVGMTNSGSGTIVVTNASPMTVADNMTSGGDITLTATDTAATGDDLTVNTGVTIQSTAGNVNLRGGDDVTITSGSVIDAFDTVTIAGDFGDADAPGTTIDVQGAIKSGNTAQILGEADADSITFNPDAGGSGTVSIDGQGGNDSYQIQLGNLSGTVAINDQSAEGTDDLTITDAAGVAEMFTVGAAQTTTTTGGETVTYTTHLEDITVKGEDESDTFNATASTTATINIVGGTPAAPTSPGDAVTFTTPAGQTTTLTPDGDDGATLSTTGGFQDVSLDEIETLNLTGSININGTAGDDLLALTATSSNAGSLQITSDGTASLLVNISSVTDFTFNGLAGDDILRINNPAGSLFDPTNGIMFDGGTGGEGNTPAAGDNPTGDALELLGGSASSVEHVFVDNSTGSVFYNGEAIATISYQGLEPVTDTITATTRTFTFTGGAETITLTDAAAPGSMTIDSTLGESVTFTNPSDQLTINAGSGNDIITINSVDAAYRAALTINGEDADDTINLNTSLTLGSGTVVGDLDLFAETVNLNAASINTDGSNGVTSGGTVTIAGDDSATPSVASVELLQTLTIDTEQANGADTDNAGAVDLEFTDISADAAGTDLNVNTSAINGNGGAIDLGQFSNQGAGNVFVNDLSITRGGGGAGSDGTVTLHKDVSLDGTAGDAGDFTITDPGDVIVSDKLTIDTETGGDHDGGNVNWGTSNVYADNAGYALTIDTTTALATQGNVTLGLVDDNATAAAFLESLTINAGSTGIVTLNGNIFTDDDGSGTASTGVVIDGLIQITGSRTIDTAQSGSESGGQVRLATTSGSVSATVGNLDLTLDARAADNATAGDVILKNFDDAGGAFVEDLTILAVGTAGGTVTLNGLIQLEAADGSLAVDSFGSVVDGNAGANNLVAKDAAFRTHGSVGTAADVLETNITAIEAESDTGVFISNTGDLVVGGLAAMVIPPTVASINGVSATNANVILKTSGNLSLTEEVKATNGTVRLESTGGNVTQTASGKISAMNLGVRAAGNIDLNETANQTTGIFAATTSNDGAGFVQYADVDGFTVGTVSASGPVVQIVGVTTTNSDSKLTAGANLVIDDNIALGNGNLLLDVTGNVTQQSGDTITAQGLALMVDGTTTLDDSGNNVTNFAANNGGTTFYRDADTLNIEAITVDGMLVTGITTTGDDVKLMVDLGNLDIDENINLGSGNLFLDVTGNVTQQMGDTITAAGLALMVDGTTHLGEANDVDTIAADTGNTVFFNDTDGLTVGTVTESASAASMSITGITTTSDDVKLLTGSNLLIDDKIDLVGGNLFLNVTGTVSQNAGDTITAAGLAIMVNGSTHLGEANDVDTIAANTGGTVFFNDTDGLTVGTVNETASPAIMSITGITTTSDDVKLIVGGNLLIDEKINLVSGNLFLDVTGTVSQNSGDTITAAGLALMVDSTTQLGEANDVDTIAANTGNTVFFNDIDGLTVGTVAETASPANMSITGITTTSDDVKLIVGGNLLVDDKIDLAAGNLFLDVTGTVSQNSGDTITAAGLALMVDSTTHLGEANDVDTIASNTGDTVFFNDTDGLIVGTVNETASPAMMSITGITTTSDDVKLIVGGNLLIDDKINLAAGNLFLDVTGTVSQNSGDTITAAGLALKVDSTTHLGEANDVDTIAANTGGTVFFNDTDGSIVGTVNETASPAMMSITGITTTSDDVKLIVGGNLLIDDKINLAAGNLFLDVTGTVSQNAGDTITAAGLALMVDSTTHLGEANDVDTIAANTGGTVFFNDTDGLTVSTVAETASPAMMSLTGITTISDDVKLIVGGNLLIDDRINLASGNLFLDVTGTVSQNAGDTITAAGLALMVDSTTHLGEANDVDTIAANTGDTIFFNDTDGLTVGTVNETASPAMMSLTGITTTSDDVKLIVGGNLLIDEKINLVSGNLFLDVTGTVSQNSGDTITAAGLALMVDSTTQLGEANDVDTIAANTGNTVFFNDIDGLTVGTVAETASPANMSITGITTTSDDVKLIVGGNLLIDDKVNLASGNLFLDVTGTVSQNAGDTITAAGLALMVDSTTHLGEANDADTITANTGNTVFFNDIDGLTVGTVAETASPANMSITGITTTSDDVKLIAGGNLLIDDKVNLASGNLFLDVTGTVSQNAGDTITAAGLALMVDGTTTLNEANDVDTLAVNSGDTVFFTDVDGITIGTVSETASPAMMSITGITTSDADVKLTSGANLVIDDDVALGSGNLFLDITGNVTQNANDDITAAGLGLMVDGNTTLDNSGNNVVTLAADNGGFLTYRDANTLTVDTVTVNSMTVTGISTTNDNVTLNVLAGDLNVNQGVNTRGGNVIANAASDINSTSAGTITTTGTVANQDSGTVQLTAGTDVALAGTVDTSGFDNVSGSDNSDGGNIDITATTGSLAVDDVTSSGGDVATGTGGNAGTILLDAATTITFNDDPAVADPTDGDISSAGGSDLSTGIRTGDGASLVFMDPVIIAADNPTDGETQTINTSGATAGDVTFQQTVDGATASANDLVITARDIEVSNLANPTSGDVTFVMEVGGTTRMGDITIADAKDFTAMQRIRAASLTQLAGIGNTTLHEVDIETGVPGLSSAVSITTDYTINLRGNITATDNEAIPTVDNTSDTGETIAITSVDGNVIVEDGMIISTDEDPAPGHSSEFTGDSLMITADVTDDPGNPAGTTARRDYVAAERDSDADGISDDVDADLDGDGTPDADPSDTASPIKGLFKAGPDTELRTDGGVAKRFPPLLDPPGLIEATTLNETTDQVFFRSEWQVEAGVQGEENLRVDIDWRDPIDDAETFEDTATDNPVTSSRQQTFLVRDEPDGVNPAKETIGHVYTNRDIVSFVNAEVTTFEVDFSVSHHESIVVNGSHLDQSPLTDPIAIPSGLITSTDDPATGTGVADPGTDVTDPIESNLDLHFESGLFEVRIPTEIGFVPPVDAERPVPAPEPAATAPLAEQFVQQFVPTELTESLASSYSSQSEDYFQLRQNSTDAVEGFEHIDPDVGWKLLQPRRLKEWVYANDLDGSGYELWLITTKVKDGQDITFERPVLKFDVFDNQPFPGAEELLDQLPELKLERLEFDENGNLIEPSGAEDSDPEPNEADETEDPARSTVEDPQQDAVSDNREPVSPVVRSAMTGLALSAVLKRERSVRASRHLSAVSRIVDRASQ